MMGWFNQNQHKWIKFNINQKIAVFSGIVIPAFLYFCAIDTTFAKDEKTTYTITNKNSDIGKPVTLYATSEDKALKASKAIHGHQRCR